MSLRQETIKRLIEEPSADLERRPFPANSWIQWQIAVVFLQSAKGPVKVRFLEPANRSELVHQPEVPGPIWQKQLSNAILSNGESIFVARDRTDDENRSRRHYSDLLDALAKDD